MTVSVSHSGQIENLDDTIRRLRELLLDLEALSRNGPAALQVMRHAAALDNWEIGVRPTLCLTGQFLDHPSIADGRVGKTSDLWIFAPHHGFARTLSRRYRLGQRAKMEGL